MAYKICIDPGHGGSDPGAVGNGFKEKDLTLKLALFLRDYLDVDQNYEPVMTRSTDINPSVNERATFGNNAKVIKRLSYTHVAIHVKVLQQVADDFSYLRSLFHGYAADRYIAFLLFQQCGDRFHQCGFASAVPAEQAEHPRCNIEVQIAQSLFFAVRFAQIPYLDIRFRHKKITLLILRFKESVKGIYKLFIYGLKKLFSVRPRSKTGCHLAAADVFDSQRAAVLFT